MEIRKLLLSVFAFAILFSQNLLCMEPFDYVIGSDLTIDGEIETFSNIDKQKDYEKYREECLRKFENALSKFEGKFVATEDLMNLFEQITYQVSREFGMYLIMEEDVQAVYEEGVDRIIDLMESGSDELMFNFTIDALRLALVIGMPITIAFCCGVLGN